MHSATDNGVSWDDLYRVLNFITFYDENVCFFITNNTKRYLTFSRAAYWMVIYGLFTRHVLFER